MKRLALPALALSASLLLLASFARPITEPVATDEGPIAEQMELIGGGMKQIRRALREEGQEEKCLGIVVEIEKAALYAKDLVPPMAEKMPEGDRAKFVAEYRKTMVELLNKMLALESALLDKDADAIKSTFQQLRGMEDSGHERFTEDG